MFTSVLVITIGFVVGSSLLLLSIPNIRELQNYRIARKCLGAAYITTGILMLLNLFFLTAKESNADMIRIIILTISSTQALLFTYSLITLINIRFCFKQELKKEIIPICFLLVVNILVQLFLSGLFSRISLGAFILYYIYILFRYTFLFRTTFKEYQIKTGNKVSENEWERLMWVNFSFYYALLVGILALFSLASLDTGLILFKTFIIPFYVYFGFHMINYGFKFHLIKPIFAEAQVKHTEKKEIAFHSPAYTDLDLLVQDWTMKKRYMEPGLTIESVARELNTNRTYLSTFINDDKQQTFRTWLNHLRIEEAQNLILNNPELSITQIGQMTGFSDNGNFSRTFSQIAGQSPLNWKKGKKGC